MTNIVTIVWLYKTLNRLQGSIARVLTLKIYFLCKRGIMLNLSSIAEGGKWEGGGKRRAAPSPLTSKIIYSCNKAIYKNNKIRVLQQKLCSYFKRIHQLKHLLNILHMQPSKTRVWMSECLDSIYFLKNPWNTTDVIYKSK